MEGDKLADTRVGERGGFYEVKIKKIKKPCVSRVLDASYPEYTFSPERLVSKKERRKK